MLTISCWYPYQVSVVVVAFLPGDCEFKPGGRRPTHPGAKLGTSSMVIGKGYDVLGCWSEGPNLMPSFLIPLWASAHSSFPFCSDHFKLWAPGIIKRWVADLINRWVIVAIVSCCLVIRLTRQHMDHVRVTKGYFLRGHALPHVEGVRFVGVLGQRAKLETV